MSSIKTSRAIAVAKSLHVHTGPVTVEHVLALVGEDLIASLPGVQLGQVMAAVNRGYQAGKAKGRQGPEE